jgi:hypothetical protein
VVGHYAVFSCLLGVMMDAPGSDWRRYGPWTACAISEVRRPRSPEDGRGAGWEIVRLNDEAHLREGVSA